MYLVRTNIKNFVFGPYKYHHLTTMLTKLGPKPNVLKYFRSKPNKKFCRDQNWNSLYLQTIKNIFKPIKKLFKRSLFKK